VLRRKAKKATAEKEEAEAEPVPAAD
jgi:hypothetical protein